MQKLSLTNSSKEKLESNKLNWTLSNILEENEYQQLVLGFA